MSQELNIIDKDPNFTNPFSSENVNFFYKNLIIKILFFLDFGRTFETKRN